MAEEKKTEPFISRWSRLKKEHDQLPESGPQQKADAPALPPQAEWTPQTDFSGFMHPKVEDALRRVALKKLFSDPHFNAPDLFEPFSGDWTVGEPIPQAMLDSLEQVKTMMRKVPEPAPKEVSKEAVAEEAERKPDEPGKQDA